MWDRGWTTLDELLLLTAHSPVDADEAMSLARTLGINVVERDSDPWDDIHTLAEDGQDAFRASTRKGPAPGDELAVEDPGTFYLHEISRTPLLTAEEEVELAKAIEAGKAAQARLESGEVSEDERPELERLVRVGEAARRRMIESNLRLVVSVARKYLGRGLNFLDLVQEGNLGLQKAVDRYDWRKGFRFSTYAYWWIRQAISRAVAEQGRTIRLPGHVFEQLSKLYNAARELQAELGRAPTTDEIAERAGVSPERVRDAFRAARMPISLEKPIGEDDSATLGDLVADAASRPPEQAAEEAVLARRLDDALSENLSPREAALIRLRFGLDRGGLERSLGDVGKEMGMSRERARQVEGEALEKLRRTGAFRREFRDYAE
jgi:RNA polymerase primary sigma factor